MPSKSFVSVFVLLPTCVYAYTTFHTTCSLPDSSTSYITAPDTRGTLGIIWSCLFTIIACTWTIQHLNIPLQRHPKHNAKTGLARFWANALWTGGKFWTKLKWMLINILAPEVVLGKAIGDFIEARGLTKEVALISRSNGEEITEWSLTHSFFLLMGGYRFIISANEEESRAAIPDTQHQQIGNDDCSETVDSNEVVDMSILHSVEYILLPQDLLWLIRHDHLTSFPRITKEEILDKSKADTLVKILAVIQIFWICLEAVVRGAKGLAVTQLELATTAFCACAVITYILVTSKPQSVDIPARPFQISQGTYESMNATHPDYEGIPMHHLVHIPDGHAISRDLKYIPNDYIVGTSDDSAGLSLLGTITGCVVFNGIHLAAWNFSFPTHIEQLLWHVAGIVTTTLIPVVIILEIWLPDTIRDKVVKLVNPISTLIYVVARIFLLVETFRSLAFLPLDAFKATWVSNIPSIV